MRWASAGDWSDWSSRNQPEHRAVQDLEVRAERRRAEGLSDIAFQQTPGSRDERIAALADELGDGQLVDLGAIDRGLNLPVEGLQGLEVGEPAESLAPFRAALLADLEFVLEEQFEELAEGEAVGGGLLQA